MTTNAPSLNAEQVREAYKLAKLERRRQAKQLIQRAELAALELPDALPNDEGVEDNLIPTDMLSVDLNAVIPSAWEADRASQLQVLLNDQDSRPIFEQTYPTLPTFPLNIAIPSREFQGPGGHRVRYRVTAGSGTELSGYTNFTVDRDDPNRGNMPDSLVLQTNQVTPEYLNTNDGLPFEINAFSYARPGDRANIYMIAPGNPDPVLVGTIAPRPVTGFDPSLPMTGTIAKDHFVDANGDPKFVDGTLSFYYLAYSRAGNETTKPLDTNISMAFQPLPTGLQNAVIPLALENPPLIDRADAILGVTVQIPAFNNHQPADQVVVTWGSRNVASFPVGSNPTFPLESPKIAYSTLLTEGGAPGGEGPKDVVANYRIVRGLLEFPAPAAASTSVDLRIPGPVNPDPGPENPRLGSVTVRGGGTNPEDNKIRVADIGLPVSVTLPAYDPMVVGEELQVFWNKQPVPNASYTVVGGETTFDIEVPYTFVAQEGDGPAIPVHIQLTSPDFPPDNAPITVPTAVEVDTFEFGTLTPPSFPDMNPTFQSLGCCERIWEGAKLRVAGDTQNFAAGDTVTVHWQGRDFGTGTVIPDTTGNQPYQLTADQAANGFDHAINFIDVVMPIEDAGGQLYAWYVIAKAGGPSATADEVDVYAVSTMPGRCRCIAEGVCDTSACPPRSTKAAR